MIAPFPNAPRVLVAEPGSSHILSDLLTGQGFRLASASTIDEMSGLLERGAVDLTVMDLEALGRDALDRCRETSRKSGAAIIVVGADRDVAERVAALDAGADRYLTQPCGRRELSAHVRALLRQCPGMKAPRAATRAPDELRFKGWSLQSARHLLSAPNGQPVRLSAREFRLLTHLAEHAGECQSRQSLHALMDLTPDCGDRTLDLVVYRLRAKLRPHGGDALVATHYDRGYLLGAAVERRWRSPA